MFEPLFGDLFDLDGDGKVTFEEELIGFHIVNDLSRSCDNFVAEEQEDDQDDDFGEDSF